MQEFYLNSTLYIVDLEFVDIAEINMQIKENNVDVQCPTQKFKTAN